MTRTWWVNRLFGRTVRPTRRTRAGAKPTLTFLEDRTVPATLTEAGTILTIDLDTAGEFVTSASQGAKYQFTTTATFKDGGVTGANFAGLGTNILQLINPAAYTEIRFTDSQPNATVRFNSSGANSYVQPFTLTLDNPGGRIAVAGTTNFGANDLRLTADGSVTQTGGNLTARLLTATGSLVDFTAGVNTLAQVSGQATAGRFDLSAASDLTVVAPGLAASDTVSLVMAPGKVLTVDAPITSTAGNVELTADDLAVNADMKAPFAGTDTNQGNVYLVVATAGQPIAIAAGTVAGSLSLSADEIGHLAAGRLVQIGDTLSAGPVTITQGFAAPAGFKRLLIGSTGIVFQNAAAGIAVDSLGVVLSSDSPLANLTAAGNDVRVFAGEGGPVSNIAFASTGPLTVGTVGTVVGLTGRNLAVTTHSPLVVANDVNGVGTVTLTATDSAGTGDDLTVNPGVTVRSQTGTVALRAGDNLALGAGAALKADAGAIDLSVDFGDADPGVGATADVSTATLIAPLGATLTGGPDADTFTVAASATAAVHVNGLTPSLPTLPGDTLNFVGSGGSVTFTPGATPDKGTIQDAALQPVTFEEVESLNLAGGAGDVVVNGTNGPDTLVLYKAAGTTFFQLNGATPVVVAAAQFTFNGLLANDTMIVDYKGGDPVSFAAFDGTDKAGDVLRLVGAPGFTNNFYEPDSTLTGRGKLGVGSSLVFFFNVGNVGNTVGIDIVNFDSATLMPVNADDQLTVANGTTFVGADPALVVTGASGLTPITPVAYRGNKTLVINTDAISPGNDTVTVASADGDHQNTNLTITTGAGTDAVNLTGPTKAAGNIAIASKDISVFAKVESTGGTVTLTNAGNLLLKATTVAGNNGVTQNGTGPVLLIGAVVLQSAVGPVSVAQTIDAAPLNTGNLTVTAPGAAAGVVTLNGSVGATNRLDTLTVTAGKQIALNGQQYLTFSDQTYNGPTTVSAGTVAFDSANDRVIFLGTLDGAAAGTSAVTVTAKGDTVFGGAVGSGSALKSLTTDGGGTTFINGGAVKTTGDQTYEDAVVVGADATLTAGGALTFAGTLDGAFAVTASAAGLTTFAKAVGGTTPLASLTANGGGATAVNGKAVTTAGPQRYDDAVTVGADTTFTAGGDVAFNGTLDGAFAVTVTAPGTTSFAAAVGGAAPLASLTTDGGGVTAVGGGKVTTTGTQNYGDPVQVTRAGQTDFTSTAGDVRFTAGLTGATADVTVLTPGNGQTVFAGGVNVRALATDAAGTTRVAGGTVAVINGMTFNDPVTADAATTFQSTDGSIAFNNTLSGAAVTTSVKAGQTVTFNAPVAVTALTTTGGGTAVVATGTVTATGGDLLFNTAVAVAPAKVTFAGLNVTFKAALTGTNTAVTVNATKTTAFYGPVSVGSLTTDEFGDTTVNGATVTTVGGQTYNDAFGYTGNSTLASTGGGAITFQKTVTGPPGASLAINTAGDTTFNNGPVNAAALTTDAAGRTVVNTGTFNGTGAVVFGDPVVVQKAVTFSTDGGAPLTFGAALDGGFDVTVKTTGTATFAGAVGGAAPLASLTVNGTGPAVSDGGSVHTAGKQTYASNVSMTKPTTFTAGDTIGIQAGFTSQTEIVFNPAVPAGTLGVSQTAGSTLATPLLTLNGAGEFRLESTANQLDVFRANLTRGPIFLSAAGNLRTFVNETASGGAGGVRVGDGSVRIRTGGNFTARDERTGAERYTPGADGKGRVVQLGNGQFVVFFGLAGDKGSTATFNGEVKAARVVLGHPQADRPVEQPFLAGLPADPAGTAPFPSADVNDRPDTVSFRASADTEFVLFGHRPLASEAKAAGGDNLAPILDADITNFQYDGEDGSYQLRGRQKVTFFNFEGLAGLSQTAFVVQTAEPGDGSGTTAQQYAIRVVRTQNGQFVPGGLQGQRLPDNPFVVSPALVNPGSPTQPPRVTFGLVNGDNVPDLILANGPGTPPLVTIIDGRAIDVIGSTTDSTGKTNFQFNDISNLAAKGLIIAQFYAFEPTFQGGLNVAAGDLEGNGQVNIVVGAETGGGPRVRTFRLRAPDAAAGEPTNLPLVPEEIGGPFSNFFAYERTFTGGVRVAVADVTGDGKADLVLTAGPGGGPRVRVFDGEKVRADAAAGKLTLVSNDTPAYADFFTVESTFRGGLFVDAGDYKQDGFADLVVGAASGGGPRVMVFDGKTVGRQPTPTVLADFFAFTDAELTDPLFPGGNRTGVGGVSFGGRNNTTGFRDILATTARGPKVVVRNLPGDPAVLRELNYIDPDSPNAPGKKGTDLTSDAGRALFNIPLITLNGAPVDLQHLNYGATVGGILDPNS